jgi:hypothetical protein
MDSNIISVIVISIVLCISSISGILLLNKINNPEKKLPGIITASDKDYSQYQTIPNMPTYL